MPDTLLSNIIRIRSNYLRAIRLEDDISNSNILGGYTLTVQALNTLKRITEGITNHSRAWTLTGPYGSGKSFFGLFLANLLDPHRYGHAMAWKMISVVDPLIAAQLQQTLKENGGILSVIVTGARASLQECLARGFSKVLDEDNHLHELKQSLENVRYSDSGTFLKWVRTFVSQVSQYRDNTNGVLILLDEMGKVLEHATSNSQESDIYLLQELAEFSARSNSHPFIFIGILHQAFETYAAFLSQSARREWAKVQGRFEDIPYHEAPTQQMRLLADAFGKHSVALPVSKPILMTWCPPGMNLDEFEGLCQKVYPLHPSVFVALPYIFRRLGQNERSLFTYLSSQEPFGFQEFLSTHKFGDILYLPNLFDYLAANYQATIYSTSRARPLTEALERLENTLSLREIEKDLLKTIGLLNWLSETSPIQATEKTIISALTPAYPESELYTTLGTLQHKSFITYRRFNHVYAIWQGSDVDLEERLQIARSRVETTLSIAEILQRYLPPRPLLAHRHSYITGTQRFFEVRYLDSHNKDTISLDASQNNSGVVLLCLPGSMAEEEEFERWVHNEEISRRLNLVVGIAPRAIHLRELVREFRALHWTKENTPELRDDPIARKEWRTRLALLEHAIRTELDHAFNLRQGYISKGSRWYYRGNEVFPKSRSGLSGLLSDICDTLYSSSPKLWNELLNRQELTAQGAGARRRLIEAILTQSDKPLMGIEKFPPERSMYETLLKRGGLHRWSDGVWQIVPPAQKDPLNLCPTWEAISHFIFGGLPEPRPLTDLYDILFAPPYGVTPGLAPVLLALFYKVHENEITLYKEGTLIIDPNVADWEVLLRRPELFSIAGCRVSGLRAAILERMARGLHVQPYIMPIVRSLIGRLKALPEYAQRTRNLPESALNLRQAAERTRSPERFLFVELPEALGLPPFEEEEFDPKRFDEFFERLNLALEALANSTPRLLVWARDVWLSSCGLPSGEEGWAIFRSECQKMAVRVTHPQLVPLVKRAAEAPESRSALESVLAFIANRPPRTWTDTDAERFEARAEHLGALWRVEAGLTDDLLLPPELRERSQKIANELETYLRSLESNKLVLRAALQTLTLRLRE
ncbi:hypothetical protein QYE77_08385 [Thermanaerothrix sp. 4228-RoL]|uniref:ATP-binding protein n=1 Tax=Thermanaerothrix solaris TaxID=3058434 RepID=A0ABU3NN54_9CHLR|nr:hypothetical protein [Thermanaerothrix sp. 4228-RoL]MDT8898283.1 hypothetical protein [Thermanaerothrix sp. 4228-RoL]